MVGECDSGPLHVRSAEILLVAQSIMRKYRALVIHAYWQWLLGVQIRDLVRDGIELELTPHD